MAIKAHVLEHFDALIAAKRRQIAQQARGIAEDMARIAAAVESGRNVTTTPIQHGETVLNTYCGELSALTDARAMAEAIQ